MSSTGSIESSGIRPRTPLFQLGVVVPEDLDRQLRGHRRCASCRPPGGVRSCSSAAVPLACAHWTRPPGAAARATRNCGGRPPVSGEGRGNGLGDHFGPVGRDQGDRRPAEAPPVIRAPERAGHPGRFDGLVQRFWQLTSKSSRSDACEASRIGPIVQAPPDPSRSTTGADAGVLGEDVTHRRCSTGSVSRASTPSGSGSSPRVRTPSRAATASPQVARRCLYARHRARASPRCPSPAALIRRHRGQGTGRTVEGVELPGRHPRSSAAPRPGPCRRLVRRPRRSRHVRRHCPAGPAPRGCPPGRPRRPRPGQRHRALDRRRRRQAGTPRHAGHDRGRRSRRR